MKRLPLLLLLFAGAVLLQGCATLLGSWKNTLVFENENGQHMLKLVFTG
jgi:hypothetical protein